MIKKLLKKAEIGLMCILLCVMCSGCLGMEILEEIPADFALYGGEEQQEAQAAGEQAHGLGERFSETNGASDVTILDLESLAGEALFLMEEAQDYGFRSLTEAEQIWYRDIENHLGMYGESVNLSRAGIDAGLNESHIDKIFQCVLLDHPELFFVEGYAYTKYTMGQELTAVEFSGTYNTDRDTALQRKEEIEDRAAEILNGIATDCSEYEKVKYVYDTIIANTEYKLDAADNQNIYSVFIHQLSVCQGYAKATQYLLNKMGVECTLVLGTVESGEGHAWNLVKVDGSYYFVDTTWGDASYRTDGEVTQNPDFATVNYDYLNVTTGELLKTHSIDSIIPMPECVSTEANYYVREGMLMTSFDRLALGALFKSRREAGYDNVTVKCASWECYNEVRTALIDKKEIFDYLQNTGDSVAFSTNDTQLSLTFWVTNE